MPTIHFSAKSSHYDKESVHYDEFNEKNSRVINRVLGKLLKKYKVKTVLDLTCGTGSQVFWLTKHGFEVMGSDFNSKMLNIAKTKAKKEKLKIKFLTGDMRTSKVGKFDAVITIFNAIGHLTKKDFEKTIKNIHENLKEGGLYIFDIFNLSYLLNGNNITRLTIDWQETSGNAKNRVIQYSTINKKGVLTSYTTTYEEKDFKKPKITHDMQTLQIYNINQLKEILHQNGFKMVTYSGIDGSKFIENKTESILVVAKKL